MSPRQSAHWYSASNPPKATELVLAENWLTGTHLHLCQPAPMATPSQRQDFPDHEGKEVIGSPQYCAVNKSPSRKVSMTGDEGKEVIGSL